MAKEILAASFKVLEVTEKSGKNGAYWSIKADNKKTYNANQSDYLVVHAGQEFKDVGYTESSYGEGEKKTTSRWLVKGKADPVEVAKKVFNVPSANVTPTKGGAETVAAILTTCFRFDNVDDAVKAYKDILAKI
jgi:hypothetical protein